MFSNDATRGPSSHADEELMPSFSSFALSDKLMRGIAEAGFEAPSAIQQKAIPEVMDGRDMIAQAQTGSGKTAAFVIPALSKLMFNRTVEILVLVPTRELSQQVVQEVERLGKHIRPQVVNVVGGQSAYRQIEQVNRGAQIVVATPGRLLDHLRSGVLKKFEPHLVVLDEADEMLDMGFIDDVKKILSMVPEARQTLLFSATMPYAITKLAKDVLKDPVRVQLATNETKNHDIEQVLCMVHPREKEDALVRLIDAENPTKAVIFCRTKRETVDLCENLHRRGLKVEALHGDMTQHERTRAMGKIKTGYARILIATDVASRGLDIKDLSHVFNFHLPENRERYTHRIGRTGRAGQKGRAISIVTPFDLPALPYLEGMPFERIPTLSSVQKLQDATLVEEMKEKEICPDAAQLCDEMISEGEAREFLYRLFSYIRQEKKLSGPERLGCSQEEIKRAIQQAQRPQRGRRKGGSFGPRGRSRSGGGGGHRGKRFDQGQSGGGNRRKSGGRGQPFAKQRSFGGDRPQP